MVDGEEVSTHDLYTSMDKEEVFAAVMERSGCREPFLQGSISNYFGWRNWGLSVNVSYSVGSKIRLLKMYNKPTRGVCESLAASGRRVAYKCSRFVDTEGVREYVESTILVWEELRVC